MDQTIIHVHAACLCCFLIVTMRMIGAHLVLNDWGISQHSRLKGSTKKAPIFNVHTKHILLYKCNGDLKKYRRKMFVL